MRKNQILAFSLMLSLCSLMFPISALDFSTFNSVGIDEVVLDTSGCVGIVRILPNSNINQQANVIEVMSNSNFQVFESNGNSTITEQIENPCEIVYLVLKK